MQAGFAQIEPAQVCFGSDDERVGHEAGGQRFRVGHVDDRLPAVALEQPEQGGALTCDHGERMVAARLDRHQHLEHEFVARRRVAGRDGFPPRAELLATGGGQRVRLLVVRDVDVHETVTLESIEGRVHLPDVQFPDTARDGFELGLELIAVAGPGLEEGEQSLTYCHSY